MLFDLDPTRIALVVATLLALGFVWYAEGRGRWRALVADRFLYGVPWGTLVTVALLVAFYAVVQAGLREWSEPLTMPFITWSYFYPTGLLTAGVAHGSPAHLASNTAGTVALAPIAEYTWGHYPPAGTDRGDRDVGTAAGGPLARPWFRAVVVFPAALLLAALLTAVFALGPGLGFSGAVFAIAGFAVVNYPVATVVAVVATSALQTLYEALTEPVVREVLEVGAPSPPPWAGVGFQAHLLGFLIGVLAGLALLRRRGRRPAGDRIFFGVLLFGMAQALWLLVLIDDDVFYLYQGVGIVMVLGLAAVTMVAVAGSERPVPRPLSALPTSRVPSRRSLAAGWLVLLVALFLAGVVGSLLDEYSPIVTIAPLALLVGLLALPALPAVVPDRWISSPLSRRQVAVGVLLVVTVLVAVPSVPLNMLVVDGGPPGSGEVEVGSYAVTYEQNATTGQTPVVDPGPIPAEDEAEDPFESQLSGVIVVNDDREIWTVGARDYTLEYDGNATVEVGGLEWRETVAVSRTGWDVIGNDTAYAVDLAVGTDTVSESGDVTRSFASDPVEAAVRIDGHSVALAPGEAAGDPFELRVDDGDSADTVAVPAVNETATVGDIEFATEEVDDAVRLFATPDAGETEVLVAERETYD